MVALVSSYESLLTTTSGLLVRALPSPQALPVCGLQRAPVIAASTAPLTRWTDDHPSASQNVPPHRLETIAAAVAAVVIAANGVAMGCMYTSLGGMKQQTRAWPKGKPRRVSKQVPRQARR